MTSITVRESESMDDVVRTVVDELVAAIASKHAINAECHISLTGGRAGSAITEALFTDVNLSKINPRLLHVWWSDERYVPVGDADRNDSVVPALAVESGVHCHSVQGPDSSTSVHDSAVSYGQQLHLALTTRFCASNTLMDVCLLSIGPDGHIASLFPEHPALDSVSGTIAIEDSPKPPPVRVTWTYPTINASEQVWLIATGAEKAERVTEVLAGTDFHEIPASGARGKSQTLLFVDKAAST